MHYKKIIAGISLAACLAATAEAADIPRFVCDGGIELAGEIQGIRVGQKVTLTVTNAASDFLDENEWRSGNTGGIVYYGDIDADTENKYDFKFALENSGRYSALIGADVLGEPQRFEFDFIDGAKNAAALAEIIAPGADIENILRTKSDDLGIFGNIRSVTDMTEAANILRTSLAAVQNPAAETVSELAQKSMLAAALNKKKISDMDGYTDIFEKDAVYKHYDKTYSKNLAAYMTDKGIDSVDKFNSELVNSVILCAVNNSGSAEKVRSVLTDYSAYLGINASKITTSLCSAAAARGGFADTAAVTAFVNGYMEPAINPGGAGGGGGGGSGSGSGGNNSYGGVVISVPENQPQHNEEYDVFADIKDAEWARDAITALYYKGIVNGRSAAEFCPNDTVKREEFVKMLTDALNVDLVGGDIDFDDISTDDWCYKYVRTAKLAGIASGISDAVFGRGMNITRQDLCVMVYNGMQACDIECPEKTAEKTFADSENISEYARGAVSALQKAGIVSGDENGYFNPGSSATRAEAARIIYVLLGFLE